MSKGVYFIFQIFWSIIAASFVWYFYPASGTFKFSLTGNYREDGMFFVFGVFIYLVFTVVQMIVGRETIKNWSKGILVITLIVAVIMFVLGRFSEQFAVQLLNSTLNLGLYIGI